MDAAGLRVTVMGLGTFGGGAGAARYLARKGARVTVTDLRGADELAASLATLDGVPIEFALGGHREEHFTGTDLVVASPAVPPTSPFLQAAQERSVPVTTEIALCFEACRAPIIGVTGTVGKSTTAALLHAMLEADPTSEPPWPEVPPGRRDLPAPGRRRTAWLGGNIGRSLLDEIDSIRADDVVVLELSSFQLHWLGQARRSPQVAVITNFAPNHLDWHGSLDAYRSAKQQILAHQASGGVAVLNDDDPDVRTWPVIGRRIAFGSDRDERRETRNESDLLSTLDSRLSTLAGFRSNAAAAAAAARVLGVPDAAIRRSIADFRGLPHRMEYLGQVGGRHFYNDSKATTPHSTVAALEGLDAPVLLIAGGADKGIELGPMAAAIAERAKGAALIGRTATMLASELEEKGFADFEVCADLQAAFAWCRQRSSPGDVILLSPGCASYGMFANYEARGEAFRALVRAAR